MLNKITENTRVPFDRLRVNLQQKSNSNNTACNQSKKLNHIEG
jgi:hypothetical protein